MSRQLRISKGTTPVLAYTLEQLLILISLLFLCDPWHRNTCAETQSVTITTAHNSAVKNRIQLREISKQAGLSGITTCGSCEKLALVEVNCGGLCWLDYNNDGFLDLFVTSGASVQDLIAN